MICECTDVFLYSGLLGTLDCVGEQKKHLIQRLGMKVTLSVASHEQCHETESTVFKFVGYHYFSMIRFSRIRSTPSSASEQCMVIIAGILSK